VRLLLLHDTEHDLPAIESVLSAHGHYVRSMAVNALTLQDEIESWNPELILIAADNAARDVLEQVCVVSQFGERPIVMFTEDHDPVARRAAIQARVSAYVVAGLSAKRVGSVIDVALERFQHDQQQFADLLDAQRRANTNIDRDQVVAQAKALLRRRGMTEPDAYSLLRKQAMRDRCTVAEVAARVLSGA
jgi:two-component system, response regulator / RNA-binding antiterminator